jgi:hypothetical protein
MKYSNVLITTFWAIEQVYMLSESFLDNLIKYFPKFKIYFLEPVGWQISNDGHMKMKSEKKNTYYYNENLYSLICKYQSNGKIKINKIILDYFYPNVKYNCGTLIEISSVNYKD